MAVSVVQQYWNIQRQIDSWEAQRHDYQIQYKVHTGIKSDGATLERITKLLGQAEHAIELLEKELPSITEEQKQQIEEIRALLEKQGPQGVLLQ